MTIFFVGDMIESNKRFYICIQQTNKNPIEELESFREVIKENFPSFNFKKIGE